jgi:hypothetical protein
MIVKTFASIEASGDDFSPAQWEKEAKIKCSLKHERGEIGTRGRFKGLPYPDGYGSFNFVEDHKNTDLYTGENDEFWSAISRAVDAARTLRAEDISMTVTIFYSAQCNLWFDVASISRLNALNIPIAISCVEDKGDDCDQPIGESEPL